jgi:hypothetical protein
MLDVRRGFGNRGPCQNITDFDVLEAKPVWCEDSCNEFGCHAATQTYGCGGREKRRCRSDLDLVSLKELLPIFSESVSLQLCRCMYFQSACRLVSQLTSSYSLAEPVPAAIFLEDVDENRFSIFTIRVAVWLLIAASVVVHEWMHFQWALNTNDPGDPNEEVSEHDYIGWKEMAKLSVRGH